MISSTTFTQSAQKATEFGEITQPLGLLRRSRSLKVIVFGTNRKPICDFLLVINSNLPPILHRFRDIVAASPTPTPISRLLQRGVPSSVSTMRLYTGSALLSGHLASMLNSRKHVDCGDVFDELLGLGMARLSADIVASTLHRFFDEKVVGIRAATAGTDPPTFTPAPVGCVLRMFTPATTEDIVSVLRALPDKQCTSDPLPLFAPSGVWVHGLLRAEFFYVFARF